MCMCMYVHVRVHVHAACGVWRVACGVWRACIACMYHHAYVDASVLSCESLALRCVEQTSSVVPRAAWRSSTSR